MMSPTELLGGAIGSAMLGLGGAAIAAWSLRAVRRQRVLLYFGLWCGLYGARLIALQDSLVQVIGGSSQAWDYFRALATYAINVPILLFVECLIGSGWKGSVRRVWQIEALYAICAAVVDIAPGRPGAAMPLNSPLVLIGMSICLANLWVVRDRVSPSLKTPAVVIGGLIAVLCVANENVGRPVIPNLNIEPLGIFAFVLSLGYGTVASVFRQEAELLSVQRELDTARRIQLSLLPGDIDRVPGFDLAARYLPMSAVAGDLYDVVRIGPSQVGILVADVSGHGIAAALVASMVKLAFSTQSEQAHDPASVLGAMNRLLCRNLDGTFVTAVYAVIDTAAKTITVATAGHPSMLVTRADGSIDESRERGVMMGVFPDASYANDRLELRDRDRILVYTDGLPEAQNPSGEFLDYERLKHWLAHIRHDEAKGSADTLMAHLTAWRSGPLFDDDVTFVMGQFRAGSETRNLG